MITSKKCLMSTNPKSEHYKKGSLESRPALEGECCVTFSFDYVKLFPFPNSPCVNQQGRRNREFQMQKRMRMMILSWIWIWKI
jgi:hypothetical protein